MHDLGAKQSAVSFCITGILERFLKMRLDSSDHLLDVKGELAVAALSGNEVADTRYYEHS